jgi:hypothetical protein
MPLLVSVRISVAKLWPRKLTRAQGSELSVAYRWAAHCTCGCCGINLSLWAAHRYLCARLVGRKQSQGRCAYQL